MTIRKHSIIHSQGVDDVRPLMPLFTTIPQVGSKVVGLSKSQSANPNNLTLVPEKEPFKVTTEQLNLANSSIENEMPESPPPKTNTNITGPPIGSETIAQSNKSQFKQTGSTIIPAAFAFGNDLFHRVGLGDAHVYVNNYVGTHGSGFTEPSTANKGRLIFYTGNQFVARSTDGGKTWTYNNPWSDMPRFCCDQDVIYDKNKQIFIWYRQEWPEGTGENYFRLGISKDTLNWWFYDVKPTLFSDGWKNQWWDGPQLALSNNYLFLTSNLIEGEKGSRAVLAKVSLDDLSNMRSISFVFAESPLTEGALRTVTPVQGATDTMYFGTHMSNEIMRVYQWPETESRSIPWFNIKIPSWYPTERGEMHCVGPGPDAYNSMCVRR